MTSLLRRFLPACENCEKPSIHLFCENCFENLKFKNGCVACGMSGLANEIEVCAECSSKEFPWKSIQHLFWYQAGVEKWLKDIKTSRRPERLQEIKSFLPDQFSAEADGIVAVSSDPGVVRDRLFSVATELGRILSKKWKLKFLGTPFSRLPFLSSQKNLSLSERKTFLSSSIELSPAFRGQKFKSLVLVDDVMTSGATLELHSQILHEICPEIHIYSVSRVESLKRSCRLPAPWPIV